MTIQAPHAFNATMRGILFLAVGISLLLHTIIPSLFLSTLIIIFGSLIMIGYGMVLLNLHVTLFNLFKKMMPKDKQ